MAKIAKIAIIAHFAFGALSGGTGGHVGGVERQTSLLSKWLVKKGHAVTLIVWDEGQKEDIVIDGVRVLKMCRESSGIPGLRFFYPRWSSLIKAMQVADADIYYQNCAEYVTGQVALWCKINNRAFIYSVASDPDCDPEFPKMSKYREKVLYRYGLRNAKKIIVQTMQQKKMLQENFNLSSVVVPMPCPGPSKNSIVSPRAPEKDKYSALWVGRISKEKRLEMLLDIAEALPQVTFTVAGKPLEKDYYAKQVIKRAENISNVNYLGMVSRDQMSVLYQESSILCCTSVFEGFPNTFLEAWSYGVPVVTTVDPDGVVERCKIGKFANEKSEIIKILMGFLKAPKLWTEVSLNARNYYLENHTVDPVLTRFEEIFLSQQTRD